MAVKQGSFTVEDTDQANASDIASAVGNGSTSPATKTFAGLPNICHCIDLFTGGYGATPTGGLLQVLGGPDGVTVVRQIPITNGGACFIPLKIRGYPGQALTVKLVDGGNGITAYVNCNYRAEPV